MFNLSSCGIGFVLMWCVMNQN